VEVDSTERADIPPFGSADYRTFGGIYRGVELIKEISNLASVCRARCRLPAWGRSALPFDTRLTRIHPLVETRSLLPGIFRDAICKATLD
jgi:hypothetical protein